VDASTGNIQNDSRLLQDGKAILVAESGVVDGVEL